MHRKKTFLGVVFGLTVFLIFFAKEGTFTFQSTIPSLLVIAIYFIIKRKKIIVKKDTRWLVFYFIVCLLSLAVSFLCGRVNSNYAIIQLLYQLYIIIWVLSLTSEESHKDNLSFFLGCLLTYSLVASLIVLYQNIILGNQVFSIKTVFGVPINKNHFATFISLSSVIAFSKILYSGTMVKKILHSILLLLYMSAIAFTASRAAIITSISAVVIAVVIYIVIKKLSFKKVICIGAIICIGLFGIKAMVSVMPSWIYSRSFASSYIDSSNVDRLYRWKNGIGGLLQSPLIGYGPGVFTKMTEFSVTEYGTKIPEHTATHNTYLDMMVDSGIIGGVIMILFMAGILRVFFKKKGIIYLPLIINVFLNSAILGASKTVYFWSFIVFLIHLSRLLKDKEANKCNNIFIGD